MKHYNEPLHLSPPAADALPADHVPLAVSAYLARFTGSSREHTESDLRCYLRWCADRGLHPLAARRPDLEQYIRWMQETCRFKPSTISRRFSVAAGFYRTCVIDAVLEHSPAEHVRRPNVPPESPTLGFTHLQFEALLTAARESANDYDFALVAMLGLLGLRIFDATGASIADLGEEHGHRVLRVCSKGTKVVLVPLPPAVGRAIDRATAGRASGPILLNSRGTRMDRHAATRRLRHLAQHAGVRITRPHPHMLRHTFVICTALAARGTAESDASQLVPHGYQVLGETRPKGPGPGISSLLPSFSRTPTSATTPARTAGPYALSGPPGGARYQAAGAGSPAAPARAWNRLATLPEPNCARTPAAISRPAQPRSARC